jgi:hypothetical protein
MSGLWWHEAAEESRGAAVFDFGCSWLRKGGYVGCPVSVRSAEDYGGMVPEQQDG